MKKVQFYESEYPYATLEKFGLTREMIEDLPMHVLDDLSAGLRSPVLPIKVKNDNGDEISCRSRFSFIYSDEGKVQAVFYPVLKTAPLEKFSAEEQKSLLSGRTIVSDVTLLDGLSTRAYIQIDPETRQVITVPASLIENNLKLASEAFHLAQHEVTSIKNGEPLTFAIGNDPVTIGVDLTDKKGIRICEGDSIEWKNESRKNGASTHSDAMDAGLRIVTVTMIMSVKRTTLKSCGMSRRKLDREISVPDYVNNISRVI